MASVEVIRVEPAPVPPPKVVLTMTEEDAYFLTALIGPILGQFGLPIYRALALAWYGQYATRNPFVAGQRQTIVKRPS